jgi:hypothetical protein
MVYLKKWKALKQEISLMMEKETGDFMKASQKNLYNPEN